jgi:oligoribonuclease NrnB/cAMP/cGMP phosphodiesterase (DHH superfamily)
MQTNINVLCITHQSCHDGAGSAWVIDNYYRNYSKMSEETKFKVHHFRVNPNKTNEFLAILTKTKQELADTNTIVISADIGYDGQSLMKLLELFPNMIVLDHHISSYRSIIKEYFIKYLSEHNDVDIFGNKVSEIELKNSIDYFNNLSKNLPLTSPFRKYLPANYYFDIEECGSTLTWKHFYVNAKIPMTLQHIHARDTWNYDLVPNSKIITIGLYEMLSNNPSENDWTVWDKFIHDEEINLQKCFEIGELMNNIMMRRLWELYQRVSPLEIKLNGKIYKGAAINTTEYTSDLGNYIVTRKEDNEYVYDFALIWNFDSDGRFRCSMRSRKGDCDVGELAHMFGGGGHQAASGCTFNNIFPLLRKSFEYSENENSTITSLLTD